MKYTNFKRRILKAYSVKLVGWPNSLGEFRNPSGMGNDALQKAIVLFKTNECRFERMSAEECAELDDELTDKPTELENSTS
ncbi:hypothetical protein FRC07_013828 [Ceratobasidium sp. 392]|nr:hypothetical protein FRC07_013828 [Ceratobasidium sp. 392]